MYMLFNNTYCTGDISIFCWNICCDAVNDTNSSLFEKLSQSQTTCRNGFNFNSLNDEI
jgi:hypothetical protein